MNLGNYSGVWCIYPPRFNDSLTLLKTLDVRSLAGRRPVVSKAYSTVNSVAVIEVYGTLTKAGSCLGGGSTVEVRRSVRQAESDHRVKSILLVFDSPGGTVAGIGDLANEIRSTTKPTVGFVEDLCCSAAYWAASQCDKVYANNAIAMVGSIGTFMAVYDVSKALENEGVKTVVVKAGEFKGGGFPGMKVTDSQVKEWQKIVDATQDEFNAALRSGRKLSLIATRRVNTGLAYTAKEAMDFNLIDGIKSFDEVLASLQKLKN
ncbi:MAG: S49 family peptidase [Planctomycetaceae bacterium]